MKTIFFSLLLIISVNAFSQKSYRVVYKSLDTAYLPFTINEQKVMSSYNFIYYLYFNDSFSYVFFKRSATIKDPVKSKEPNLSKPIHHEIFFDRYKKQYYYGVAYPNPKHPYFIKDTAVNKSSFYIESSLLQFKEWRCKEAYAVLETGDTVFALLAIDYPYPYTPLNNIHFPYLPLELYYPASKQHLQVTLIEPAEDKLYLAPGIPIISMEEWKRKKMLSE